MKILAFGEVMMRMMPSEYKTLSQVNTLEFLFTGTGVNILSSLYQMGHEVYLTTRLPNNVVGKVASANIRKLGISDKYIHYGGNHIGIYFLEKGIGNRPSQVTYLNRKDSSFGQSCLNDYDFSCLDGMDVLHICGISLALNERIRRIAFEFVNEAKKRNVMVVFDCNYRPALWNENDRKNVKYIYEKILKEADIVFAGLKDATLLLNKQVDDFLPYNEQLKDALRQMSNDYNIKTIFGTIRSQNNYQDYLQGYIFCNDELILSEKYELTVYDRVGGGDGFASGAIHGYISQMDKQELINYATVSSVLAHTTYGDSPISTKEDIFNFIRFGKTDIKR